MSNTIPTSWVEPPIPHDQPYGNSRRVSPNPPKIFIVHGHDDQSKYELANFLYQKGFEPIILHEQPNGGRTIIEKFEQGSLDVRYAFVLLTPDDQCDGHSRPRQNVILELGYFWGKLKRGRVCCLSKGQLELPSDMHGIALIPFKQSVKEVYCDIQTELGHAGYSV